MKKIAFHAIIGLVLLVVLTACGKVEQNSQVAGYSEQDQKLVAIAQKINDGNISITDALKDLTPIEQGRTMDIAGELLGIPTDPATSTETIQKTALELFGVGMMELDEASQKLVVQTVYDSVKGVRSNCTYTNYNQSVKYKKKSKKYKKKKKHYPVAIGRTKQDWRDWPCDFEIVFAKSGRKYIYSDHSYIRDILRKLKNQGKPIAARDKNRRVVLGYWTVRSKFWFASTDYATHMLRSYTYLWKK